MQNFGEIYAEVSGFFWPIDKLIRASVDLWYAAHIRTLIVGGRTVGKKGKSFYDCGIYFVFVTAFIHPHLFHSIFSLLHGVPIHKMNF